MRCLASWLLSGGAARLRNYDCFVSSPRSAPCIHITHPLNDMSSWSFACKVRTFSETILCRKQPSASVCTAKQKYPQSDACRANAQLDTCMVFVNPGY